MPPKSTGQISSLCVYKGLKKTGGCGVVWESAELPLAAGGPGVNS